MFIFSFLLFSFLNHAQISSTTDALGGAGIANAHPIDSAYLNPAGLAAFADVYFSGQYFFGKQNLGNTKQWGVTLADASQGNIFKGSLTYRRRKTSLSPQDVKEEDYIATGAVKLTQRWSVGAHIYKKQTDSLVGSVDQYNGDFGAMWQISDKVALGFTQFGLVGTKNTGIAGTGLTNRTSLGVSWSPLFFVQVLADLTYYNENNPRRRLVHALGVALSHTEYIFLRLGARIDDAWGGTYYTGGLYFNGPKFKLGYAYQKEVRRDIGGAHTIDLSFNF
ncbi:MAG: hypothetical protein H6623_02460 [Bdellovibrionaceae bacterium]|nr:hypothetical protein [Pseudobdellovibrionaceae bacterium]